MLTQPMICSGCKKHYDSIYNEKARNYYKTYDDCRKKKGCRKKQQPLTPHICFTTQIKVVYVTLCIGHENIVSKFAAHISRRKIIAYYVPCATLRRLSRAHAQLL